MILSLRESLSKVLMQTDAPGGNTVSLVQVTIPVGGREGKHTHPGPLIVHVVSGAFSLDYEGKPNITYSAGETFMAEPGHVHEGINRGTVPAISGTTVERSRIRPAASSRPGRSRPGSP